MGDLSSNSLILVLVLLTIGSVWSRSERPWMAESESLELLAAITAICFFLVGMNLMIRDRFSLVFRHF
jgi:hypothetical protein